MPSEKEYQDLLDQIAAVRATAMRIGAPLLAREPRAAEVLNDAAEDITDIVLPSPDTSTVPPDAGLAQLVGIGEGAGSALGDARLPVAVAPYDESVTRERIVAMADLYYIYQHEKLGVFRVVQKLQQLFRAGAVRLSSGNGAYRLYQFDRRRVLRYTKNDRLAAYCRAFGYCATPAPAGARANGEFHHLFSQFNEEVALFWRDKRISEVMRERANDPSFGSIATVRRAGLDLRNNLKFVSYGHLNVLRVEVMQLLDEAFRVVGSEDIRNLFGADNAWDVIEEVLTRYFNEAPSTSPRQRMAVAGRDILRWLAQPHILQTSRTQFEGLLVEIAETAEEWLTSAESLGISEPRREGRVMNWKPRVVKKEQTA